MLNPTLFDWSILLLSFGVAIGIGISLKPSMKTGRDFLQAGRSLPAWICGLAFLGVSLGAPEVIGMGAWGARYGLEAAQFFGIGAIPAMIAAGLFFAPIFYRSGARSVPEFLGLRFDSKTRVVNAALFASMTVVSSGISMYVLARLIQSLHVFDGLFYALGWPQQAVFSFSILLFSAIVLLYVLLGGLAGAMYNQGVQFFLILAAFLPLVYLGLRNIGGWAGLKAAAPAAHTHAWQGILHSGANPMGLEIISLGLGVGFVLGAGYWCTDFRVMQTAMAAKDVASARRAPLIAAIPRLFLPFLIVLPGLIAIGLPTPHTSTQVREQNGAIYHDTTVVPKQVEAGSGLVPARIDPFTGKILLDSAGKPLLDYAMATPSMMVHYFPTGILGLGLAALLASFMSGMAGNLTAFNTVVTCDLYQACIRKNATDKHVLFAGRAATVAGVLLSIAAAFAAAHLGNVLDALLLVFSVVNAPLLACLLLGMLWKRATGHGAFSGLIAGAAAAVLHHGLTLPMGANPGIHGGWLTALYRYPGDLAQGIYGAIFAFGVALLAAALVSIVTSPRPESELAGLMHSPAPTSSPTQPLWWKRPEALAGAILLAAIALNIFFA